MSTEEVILARLEQPGWVVLKFGASWCMPCKAYAPIFKAVMEKAPSVTALDLDVETHAKLAHRFSVRGVPFTVVIKDGRVCWSQAGLLSEAALKKGLAEAQVPLQE